MQEVNEHGEVQRREMLSSYEDAYTTELLEVYEWVAKGKAPKTTAEDALQDMKLFDMMYKAWDGTALKN